MNTEKIKIENEWSYLFPSIIGAITCVILSQETNMTPIELIIIGVLSGIIVAVLLGFTKIPYKILCCISKRYKEKWTKTHAFMFFPDKSHENIKRIELPIGKSTHLFWIKSYRKIELKGFTIRFIPTRGISFKCKQAPSSIIEIEKAELKWDSTDIVIHKDKNHILEKEKPFGMNEPSKWHCWFDGNVISNSESPIGIKVTVNAKEYWKGYFSIESRSQERFYGRIKVKVKQ